MSIKILVYIIAGTLIAVNLTSYFAASSLINGATWQQLAQIKHSIWIAISIYLTLQAYKHG